MSTSSVANKTKKLFDSQACKCFYCGHEIELADGNLDHIKPKSEGGSKMLDNLAFCCKPMNGFMSNMSAKSKIAFLMRISAHYGLDGAPKCSEWSAEDKAFMLKTRASIIPPVSKAPDSEKKAAQGPNPKYDAAIKAVNACTKRTKQKASGNGRDMITIDFGGIKAQYNVKSSRWCDPERSKLFYGLNAFLHWVRFMDRSADILPPQETLSKKDIQERRVILQSFLKAHSIKTKAIQGRIFHIQIGSYTLQFDCVTQDWEHPLTEQVKRGTRTLLAFKEWAQHAKQDGPSISYGGSR